MAGPGRSFKLWLLRRCRPYSRRGAACGCELFSSRFARLHQRHPLIGRVRDAVGNGPLIAPEPHRARHRRGALGATRRSLRSTRSAAAGAAAEAPRAHGGGPHEVPSLASSVSTARTSTSTSTRSAGDRCGSRDPTRLGIARQPERTAVRTAPHSRSTASASTREPRRRAF